MTSKRIISAVAGALVAGLVLGSVVSGYAAGTKSTTTTRTVANACGSACLQLGSAVKAGGGRLVDVVAKLTGSTVAEVSAKRSSGKTFAQIAAENSVSSSAVIAEAVKARQSVLDARVADGTITRSQADTALENMKTRLTDRIDSATACTGAGAGAGGCAGGGCGAGGGRGQGGGAARGSGNCGNCPSAQ